MGDDDGEAIDLLIVDDNPADIRFITEALESSGGDLAIHSVTTSDAALAFVYQREEYADAPELDAVFLDWDLAQTTGKEVLDALKADYPHIPVAVMTGSISETDSNQSSFSQADMNMEKPTEPEAYIEALYTLY